eukprot:COSAG06_NODE_6627_length_2850_cov_1.776081_2_plen_80_part_00
MPGLHCTVAGGWGSVTEQTEEEEEEETAAVREEQELLLSCLDELERDGVSTGVLLGEGHVGKPRVSWELCCARAQSASL